MCFLQTARDGNCMYRSIAKQLFMKDENKSMMAVKHLILNVELENIEQMQDFLLTDDHTMTQDVMNKFKDGVFGEINELIVFSVLFGVKMIVFHLVHDCMIEFQIGPFPPNKEMKVPHGIKNLHTFTRIGTFAKIRKNIKLFLKDNHYCPVMNVFQFSNN